MNLPSIWLSEAGVNVSRAAARFPKLTGKNQHYDVAVVGGGIFGCTTAHLLKSAGKKVAILEARSIGNGVTAFSTAKLSAQQGPTYSTIAKARGNSLARAYYDMNIAAITYAEELIGSLHIDCDFERRDHCTWTVDESKRSMIQDEYNKCMELGIPCEYLGPNKLNKEFPSSLGVQNAVSFPNQAQFNSYKFCVGLVDRIAGADCDVFENTRVTTVNQNFLSAHILECADNDSSVTADHVVLATHLPIVDRSLHFSILEPSRSHCIAVRIQCHTMRSMSISADMPMRSLRMTGENNDVLVISGNSIKQGDETDIEALYQDLENWARTHFDVKEVVTRWSAMDYMSADHVPYMGYLFNGTNSMYTATGFSKWGLTAGIAGAHLVNDLVHGRESPFYRLVDATRFDPANQAKGAVMENAHTVKHLIGDKVKHAFTTKHAKDLAPDEGGIVRVGLSTAGVYRDRSGAYHAVRPVCTHLGCDLVFNNGDRMWDCPCHGSVFSVDGEVVHGPATKPLGKVDLSRYDW